MTIEINFDIVIIKTEFITSTNAATNLNHSTCSSLMCEMSTVNAAVNVIATNNTTMGCRAVALYVDYDGMLLQLSAVDLLHNCIPYKDCNFIDIITNAATANIIIVVGA